MIAPSKRIADWMKLIVGAVADSKSPCAMVISLVLWSLFFALPASGHCDAIPAGKSF